MAEVTAAAVKQLREKTGAGMMECKNALVEAEGNQETAVDILRKRGLASAKKREGRIAAEAGTTESAGEPTGVAPSATEPIATPQATVAVPPADTPEANGSQLNASAPATETTTTEAAVDESAESVVAAN